MQSARSDDGSTLLGADVARTFSTAMKASTPPQYLVKAIRTGNPYRTRLAIATRMAQS